METILQQLLSVILSLLYVFVVEQVPVLQDGSVVAPSPHILGENNSLLPTSAILHQPAFAQPAIVSRVIDGDTIKVFLNNEPVTIRLIGIDTPEVNTNRSDIECFGIEASERAKNLMTGKNVYLEVDESQSDRDRYGRLLRYIWLDDGTNINEKMIADGYAYEYTYAMPYKYQKEFRNAQVRAQTNKLGLWADTTCKGVK